MKKERENKIMEAACDLCHWPYVYRDETTMHAEKCDFCPIEAELRNADREDLQNLAVQITGIFVEELRKVPEAVAKAMARKWKEFTGDGEPEDSE